MLKCLVNCEQGKLHLNYITSKGDIKSFFWGSNLDLYFGRGYFSCSVNAWITNKKQSPLDVP